MSQPADGQSKTVNFTMWVDEVVPESLAEFERRTGIRVNPTPLEANQVLVTKLLAGHSDFDVVEPGTNFVGPLIVSGTLRKLDKSKLPNWKNLDPEWLKRAATVDPGNLYGIPYLWGTTGIAMNTEAVTRALGETPPRSWRLMLDPHYASRLQHCGIAWPETSWDSANFAQLYLGLEMNGESEADLKATEAALMKAIPYARYLANFRGDTDLMSGDICVENANSGVILQIRAKASSGRQVPHIDYFIPDEGGMIWLDILAIPVDAPHVEEAYRFLDYLLDPQVIAAISNTTRYPNSVRASLPLVDEALRNNPDVYPPEETLRRCYLPTAESPEYSRLENRMWARVRAQETKP